jgi:predicted ATPase
MRPPRRRTLVERLAPVGARRSTGVAQNAPTQLIPWQDLAMASLDRIEIDGYRSIKKLKLDFRSINILIGANGSGKSNLVGAFGLLGDLVENRLQLHVGKRGGANAILHFGTKKTKRLRIRVRFGRDEYEAVLEPASKDRLIFASEKVFFHGDGDHGKPYDEDLGSGHKESALDEAATESPNKVADHVLKAMRGWKVFQFHDTSATAAIKQKHTIGDNRTLQPDGANLAALLYGLRKRVPKKYRMIVDTIRAVAPFFDDFALEPDELDPKMIQLEWRHKSDPSYFDAHSLSDGTIRFMCLAALLLQPSKPSVIVIDEPELGLHPAAIVQLAALLRLASHECQVVIATQSVTLLDQFASEDVIVVERSNGESTFHRLAKDQVRGWLDDYSLGELWLKNVLGGRPS